MTGDHCARGIALYYHGAFSHVGQSILLDLFFAAWLLRILSGLANVQLYTAPLSTNSKMPIFIVLRLLST